MNKKLLSLSFACIVVLAGCGGTASDGTHSDAHHAANGDLRETTASADTLPRFLDDQPNVVRNAYVLAAMSADLLPWIPCYCGCGESAGHESNLNCFIHEVKEDGSVVWDDHGTRCDVCLEIAVESVLLKKEGRSLQEIRDAIDAKYKEGYAAPTPTPMPAAM